MHDIYDEMNKDSIFVFAAARQLFFYSPVLLFLHKLYVCVRHIFACAFSWISVHSAVAFRFTYTNLSKVISIIDGLALKILHITFQTKKVTGGDGFFCICVCECFPIEFIRFLPEATEVSAIQYEIFFFYIQRSLPVRCHVVQLSNVFQAFFFQIDEIATE